MPELVCSWRFGPADLFWIIVVVLAGGFLWLPGLGTRGLWTSGEARAAQVARRMVGAGDYVTMRQQMYEPHLTVAGPEGDDALAYDSDGSTVVYEHAWRRAVWERMSRGPLRPEIRYEPLISIHKPVFYYWLIAGAHRLGMDVNNFTVRCFSTVPAMTLLAVTYLLGCVLYSRRVGIVAAFALATCVQFWWQARICHMDMLLALMMTAAFLLWYVGDRSDRRVVRFTAFGGIYVLLAASSLIKSFAYMLLAGLIVLVFLAVETALQNGRRGWLGAYARRVWQVMGRMHVAAGALVYLALVVPWFVLVDRATDGQYTRVMFLTHMFSRAGLMQYGLAFDDKTGWWFYVARIWVDLFPWVIMLPGAVVQVFRPRCRGTRRSGAFLLSWVVVWFVFFSAMHYRKNEYILPLYPAAMVLVAKMLVDFVRDQATDVHLGRAIRSAFVGLAIVVVVAGAFGVGLMNDRFQSRVLPILGTNRNDGTALNAVADLLQSHPVTALAGFGLLIGALVVAAVAAYHRRAGIALVMLAGGTAFVMLVGTNVVMDRLIDPRRTQRVFVQAIVPYVGGDVKGRRPILFATEQHELVYRMPDRFDSVPGIKPGTPGADPLYMLKSRLAAKPSPAWIVMERETWERIDGHNDYNRAEFGESDPWVDRLREVTLNPAGYDEDHREPLVLLRYDPAPATGTASVRAPVEVR